MKEIDIALDALSNILSTIEHVRASRLLSISAFSKELDVSRQSYTHMLKGNPGLKTLLKVLEKIKELKKLEENNV